MVEFRAQITFACPKTNKVRIRVVSDNLDDVTGKTNDDDGFNVFHLTYTVAKDIKLK